MKFSNVLIFAAGVYRASAIIGRPLCEAACNIIDNPIAKEACKAGCSFLNVSEEEAHTSPRFLPDGTVVFEKESPQCEETCKALNSDRLSYAACLGGCAATANAQKK